MWRQLRAARSRARQQIEPLGLLWEVSIRRRVLASPGHAYWGRSSVLNSHTSQKTSCRDRSELVLTGLCISCNFVQGNAIQFRLMERRAIGAFDLVLWLVAAAITERGGSPWLSAVFALAAFALLLWWLFTGQRISKAISAMMRLLFAFLVMCAVTGGTICYVREYVAAHTPWCYGFFHRGIAPDGSPSDTWLFAVVNPTTVPAHNVTVNVWDVTNLISGSRAMGKLKQSTFRFPVVYPYSAGPNVPCRAARSPLSFGNADLGKEYQIDLVPDDGEAVTEDLVFRDGAQCTTIREMRNNKELVTNATPQFDEFGGCQHSVSCTGLGH